MRVLIAHGLYLPDFEGGGEYIVHEVAKGLAQRGVQVRVLTSGEPGLDIVDGIPVRRLPMSKYRFNLAVRQLYREARDVDIVQTFTYHACAPAWAAARWAGKPVVCGALGFFGAEWRSMRGPIVGRLFEAWEKILFQIPYDAVGFLSDYSRKTCSAVAPKRAFVCPPGIAHENFRAGEKDDIVLFVGKLEERKGIDVVVETARRLPHVSFKAVGWADDIDALRNSAPPNLIVEDFSQGKKMYDTFARARIFLFPSRAETFGLVVAEAMASGCAVVSSVPLGFSGVLVDPANVEEVVTAVDTLWKDRERTARMGAENVERARSYTWANHIDILCGVYRRLIEKRASQHPNDRTVAVP